jgi:hypothetical protein
MAILSTMAIPKIKATYSLGTDSVRALERMARRWGVSKSEALRRAIGIAAAHAEEEDGDAVTALGRLQRSAAVSESGARNWVRRTRATRRASSEKRGKSGE